MLACDREERRDRETLRDRRAEQRSYIASSSSLRTPPRPAASTQAAAPRGPGPPPSASRPGTSGRASARSASAAGGLGEEETLLSGGGPGQSSTGSPTCRGLYKTLYTHPPPPLHDSPPRPSLSPFSGLPDARSSSRGTCGRSWALQRPFNVTA